MEGEGAAPGGALRLGPPHGRTAPTGRRRWVPRANGDSPPVPGGGRSEVGSAPWSCATATGQLASLWFFWLVLSAGDGRRRCRDLLVCRSRRRDDQDGVGVLPWHSWATARRLVRVLRYYSLSWFLPAPALLQAAGVSDAYEATLPAGVTQSRTVCLFRVSLSLQTPGPSPHTPPRQNPSHPGWQPPHTPSTLSTPTHHPTWSAAPLTLPLRTVPRGGRTARGRTQRQLPVARATRSLRSASGCRRQRPRLAVPAPSRSAGGAGGKTRSHASALPPSVPLVARGGGHRPARAGGGGGSDGGTCSGRPRAAQMGDAGGWRPPRRGLAGMARAATASTRGVHAPAHRRASRTGRERACGGAGRQVMERVRTDHPPRRRGRPPPSAGRKCTMTAAAAVAPATTGSHSQG